MSTDIRPEDRAWNDGLIARRARPDRDVPEAEAPADDDGLAEVAEVVGVAEGAGRRGRARTLLVAGRDGGAGAAGRLAEVRASVDRGHVEPPLPVRGEGPLRERLRALRELIGLSRARLDGEALAEAGRVLDGAAARGRLSSAYTAVAVAGATGSGKSTLFNALAGAQLSEVGTRRPTTAVPVACVWEAEGDHGSEELLERLGVPPRSRRRAQMRDAALRGLVLVDLPDFDSAAPGHREQVDRLLGLVDAVIWVADPEKYADALLHEHYLRRMAGHAEVTFVVLNQTDRLPADAVDTVLDDLRRLLDEDGMALGEHGEPGATVLALSALTGEGVGELRRSLGGLVSERRAAELRLSADMDGAVARLRPAYMVDTPYGPAGLTEHIREDFEDRLASAVGAAAAGQTAERLWLRHAEHVCGTPWTRLLNWYETRHGRGEPPVGDEAAPRTPAVARPVLAQAVRILAEEASAGLPQPWAKSVRDAAWRGADGLPEALEGAVAEAGGPEGAAREARLPRPRWWTAAAFGQGVLLGLQLLGLAWLVSAVVGGPGPGGVLLPVGLLVGGALGGPLLAWCCRAAARGPAQEYGLEEEMRLRRLAAGWGQAWVLEPVAAELLRYREVREQYVIAAGGSHYG